MSYGYCNPQYHELDKLIKWMITKILIGYTRASILGKFEYSITMNEAFVLYMLYNINETVSDTIPSILSRLHTISIYYKALPFIRLFLPIMIQLCKPNE